MLENSHTAFPANVEVQFSLVMAVSSDRAPQLLGVAFLGALLVQTAGLTVRLGGDGTACAASMALVAAMPAVSVTASAAFVDVPYACFVLAALRVGLDTKERRHVLAAGLLSGLASGTKYTGLIAMGVIAASMMVNAPRRAVSRLPLFILVSSLTAGPWYLRNALELGSPIYPPPPGLWRFVTVPSLTESQIVGFHEYIRDRGRGVGTRWFHFLALPFTFTMFTSMFHGAGGIGLVPLALGPFGALRVIRNNIGYLVFVALGTLSWFLTQQEAHFLIPVVCVVTVMAAVELAAAWRGSKTTRALSWSAFGLSVCVGLLALLPDNLARIRGAFSSEYHRTRMQTVVTDLGALTFLNATPSVTRVLLLYPVPTYYLEKPYVAAAGPHGELPLGEMKTPEGVLAHLGELGVSHVVANLVDAAFERLEASGSISRVFQDGACVVFSVAGGGG
jgi:4-amino-4-deoxy-L-arabinose transferase-like glycosyltransferase